jgi:hypothetical protein
MITHLLTILLALAPLSAQTVRADDAIRMRAADGKPRAEVMLNPDHRCVLEEDAVVCTRISK